MRNRRFRWSALWALVVGLGALGLGAPGGTVIAAAEPDDDATAASARDASSPEEVCSVIGREAAMNDLPPTFFTRLIWQESRFDPRAVSHKGAQGIAQFMPGTARWRGLDDAHDLEASLREAAKWLGELRHEFGNLGLAAAAYNAGPGRVRAWLDGKSTLPAETRRYVQLITGISADEWSNRPRESEDEAERVIPCREIVSLFARVKTEPAARIADGDGEEWGPWGLQLLGAWSPTQAMAGFRRLQQRFSLLLSDRKPLIVKGRLAGRGQAAYFRVRIAESTRDKADRLCARLSAAGGACVVFRN